jgi:antitoxin HicB
MRYPVNLSKDTDGSILVTFPDFPEAITYGDDNDDALSRAEDALETAIIARIEDWEDIPEPSKGKHYVYLNATAAVKIMLYMAIKKEKIKKAELGRRVHWKRQQVDRVFNIKHATRIDALEEVATALNRRIEVTVRKDVA